eukprot:GHVL01016150.1.p1 GENE.GHVL01016150.1~~GHVL01016150.1.p1  ORF type:complete len:369 (+),score=121.11 GHVL01016150.1:67-1107(+)
MICICKNNIFKKLIINNGNVDEDIYKYIYELEEINPINENIFQNSNIEYSKKIIFGEYKLLSNLSYININNNIYINDIIKYIKYIINDINIYTNYSIIIPKTVTFKIYQNIDNSVKNMVNHNNSVKNMVNHNNSVKNMVNHNLSHELQIKIGFIFPNEYLPPNIYSNEIIINYIIIYPILKNCILYCIPKNIYIKSSYILNNMIYINNLINELQYIKFLDILPNKTDLLLNWDFSNNWNFKTDLLPNKTDLLLNFSNFSKNFINNPVSFNITYFDSQHMIGKWNLNSHMDRTSVSFFLFFSNFTQPEIADIAGEDDVGEDNSSISLINAGPNVSYNIPSRSSISSL